MSELPRSYSLWCLLEHRVFGFQKEMFFHEDGMLSMDLIISCL